MITQSLLGVVALWLFVMCAPVEDDADQVRFTHGIGLYISSTMIVSFSLLRIKAAAILWLIQGVLQGRPRRAFADQQVSPVERAGPRRPLLGQPSIQPAE